MDRVDREVCDDGISGPDAAQPFDSRRQDVVAAVLGRTRDLDGEDLEGTTLSLVVNAARSVENAID
ncbi:MAG: hypothetical protein ABEH66_06660 [Halobacteriales archaeon]